MFWEPEKIGQLPGFGLVSPRKDYLGQLIIDAYLLYCASIALNRDPGLPQSGGEESLGNRGAGEVNRVLSAYL